MDISLDYRSPSQSHCDVAIFVNHALAGVIVLRQDELFSFEDVIRKGLRPTDSFVSRGDPTPPGSKKEPQT